MVTFYQQYSFDSINKYIEEAWQNNWPKLFKNASDWINQSDLKSDFKGNFLDFLLSKIVKEDTN